MSLSEILQEIGELSNRGNALQSNIRGFVNRAQRSICSRRDWQWMHDRKPVSIPDGETSGPMPSGFKKLSDEASPISYSMGNFDIPVTVTSRSRLEMWFPWPYQFNITTYQQPGIPLPILIVFMEMDGPSNGWRLHIPPQFAQHQALSFNVSGFYYPEDLNLGTDSNFITDNGDLCEALINKAKSLAYFAEDPASKQGIAAQALYEYHLSTAMYTDAAVAYQGRPLRM